MFQSINKMHKRVLAAFLSLCMIASSILPGLGSAIVVHAAKETREASELVDGTLVTEPEQGKSYYFDFLANDKLQAAEAGSYGLLTLSENIGKNGHGPAFGNGTSFDLKVRGNVKVSVGYCAYDSEGQAFTVTTDGTGSVSNLPAFPAKSTFKCYEQSGKTYSFKSFNDNNDVHKITISFNATCYVPYILVEPVKDTTVTGIPEANHTYEYDFTSQAAEVVVPTSYTKENPIGTLDSKDELLTINGNKTMYSHGDDHGLVVKDGQSFEVKVAGNAFISFKGCKYSKDAKVEVAAGLENGKVSTSQASLTVANDGDATTIGYAGAATVLRFTVSGSGYLHGITVKNTTEPVEVKQWAKKDFTLQIGSTIVSVEGAVNEKAESAVTVSEGSVYQSTSKSAYISIPLNGKKLSNVAINNESDAVVENVQVNDAGDLVVTMKDQDAYPGTYTIKVQDSSLFKTPFVTDVETYNFTSGVVPNVFTAETSIKNSYTIDNGILGFGIGEGKTGTYYHDASHGLAVRSQNYMDVKVAGDALISFSLCQYGAGGTLAVSNLPEGATGEFDKNDFKGTKCGDVITYSYTGGAATIRFTLDCTGESYLHAVTVKNTGKVAASDVANEQAKMPVELDESDSFTITPNGHRLYASHTNTKAGMASLDQLGYYLFDATSESCTLEMDLKINALGTKSDHGIFAGVFNADGTVSQMATVGIRGDKKVRNIYSKPSSTAPSAGGINTSFSTDDEMHLVMRKESGGFFTSITMGGETYTNLLKYSNTPLFTDGQNTLVRYGIAFSNVDALITNLCYKDSKGNVLYDQNDCYEAIGNAPAVDEVSQIEVSKDRLNATISWTGENCTYDGSYKVELSTDGGATYKTLSDKVREKSYTADIKESGNYKFRIRGVCGAKETSAIESEAREIVAPLEAPQIKAESGNGYITLNWAATKEAVEYDIYRRSSEEEVFTKIASTKEITFKDANLENETPFYYYLIAKSEDNTSNPSNTALSVPSAGHVGEYEYGKDACDIAITKKSYDTVYKNTAVLEGVVSKKGTLTLVVNGKEQQRAELKAKGTFSFVATLEEGRNDVTLYVTDAAGKKSRKTFNFVYLTNYDMVIDGSYTGEDGGALPGNDKITVYKTVQAAVDAVPAGNTERKTILVKEGSYREHLVVASPYITLIGEDRDMVNINYYDAKETPAGGDMKVRCATNVLSSATGFTAENLTFENTYKYTGDSKLSNESADALRVDADHSTFVNVKMMGYQDTLDASSNHQYYYKCYIAGLVDYIYGYAQAVFDDCDLVYRYNATKNAGYVTAPKTEPQEDYGYIFTNCRVKAEDGCNGSGYLLARPWGPDGAAAFLNCYMSGIVNQAAPYDQMSGNLAENARFREYYTYGDGFAINSNRPQLSKRQAETMLTPEALGWNPYKVVTETNYVGTVVTEGKDAFIENEYYDDTFDPESTVDTGLGIYGLNGYAAADRVTGGGNLLETSANYYSIKTEAEFLEALDAAKKTGKETVLELVNDLNLGSKELGATLSAHSSIIKAHNMQALLHPTLQQTGVSMLSLKGMSNLTIFSKNGASIKHACIDINGSKNIMIRNITFDELWEWDEGYKDEYEAGEYDRNDWDYITVENDSTDIWIDHCTFYRSYDGIVDVKKAGLTPSNVTISWSKFLPGSAGDGKFFEEMMNLLENNKDAYPYYKHLSDDLGMTKEQIRYYAASQKKTHLVGSNDTEANFENLRLTLANNYYKNSCDRMPRLRGGYSHVYNCIMDSSELYAVRNSITNLEARSKIVSNGALSTCNGQVLVENTEFNGIKDPLISGNFDSPRGYIAAVNSLYFLNGQAAELKPIGNPSKGLEPLVLDVNAFKSKMPYGNVDYCAPDALRKHVLPHTGSGVVSMTSAQWEKTSYNDATRLSTMPGEETEQPTDPTDPIEPSKPVESIGEVTGIRGTASTPTTITLAWNSVADATGYQVIYKDAAGRKITKTIPASKTSLTITGLAPNTSHSIEVRSYKVGSSKNIYGKCNAVQVRTASLKAPSKLVSKATSTEISLSFTKAAGATGYQVTYKDALGKKVTLTTRGNSFTLKKLPANHKYEFAIRSYVKVGNRMYYSDTITKEVRTSKTNVSGKVKIKKAISPKHRTIKLTYQSVKHADGYEVSYSRNKNSGYNRFVVGKKTSVTLGNLKSHRTYYVRVRYYTYEYRVTKGKVTKHKVYSNYSYSKVRRTK